MRLIERPFSDLLRKPREVTGDLDEGDVLLRRRDEPDLRLSRADREAQRADTFSAIGRALRSLAVHSPAAFADALADALPWIVFLPAANRRLFLDEFSRVVLAGTALDDHEALSQLVREEVACDCRGPRRLEACATAPARRRGDRRARLRS